MDASSFSSTTRLASVDASHQLATAIDRTRRWLLKRQAADGHWCAELEGDSILQSEFILLLAFCGREKLPLAARLGRRLLEQQQPDGGWGQYPGAAIDISASVKAYFALKILGYDPESEPMVRARSMILLHGGADAVNSFTRFYLALLGQIPYECCPAVPPEFVLLPNWFPISLPRLSAWSRTMVVPLSLMWALRPKCELKPEHGIAELMVTEPRTWPVTGLSSASAGIFSWRTFFLAADSALKLAERWGVTPLRQTAIRAAEDWMLTRFKESDGLGAIYPPMVWSLIALKALGYDDDHPHIRYCWEQLDRLVVEGGAKAWMQPCQSPVWDTAITLRGLEAGGVASDDPAITQAIDWLLDREVSTKGDWSDTVAAEPGGWFFEYRNAFYPDVDDTAMVLLALRPQFEKRDGAVLSFSRAEGLTEARRRVARTERMASAAQRARDWLLAMQNRDGGWGAFDRDNDAEFLCQVPFADHNAMIDPSTPDIAARVLEALGAWGAKQDEPAVARALDYLRRSQEADGSWIGRWGVNYIYGTWQTIVGLRAVGIAADDPMIARGAQWLIHHQQTSGGWGETADSYIDPSLRGQGTPTASQTAWALLGLLAAGKGKHPAVRRGIEYLLATQRSDGGWDEAEFTGTGFPKVFYLRYHYYPIYFPLMALGEYARSSAGGLK